MNLTQLLSASAVLARLAGSEVPLADALREESLRSRDEAQFRAVQGLDGERARLDVLRRCALRRAIGAPGADPALEARADAFRRDDFLGRWAARGFDLPVEVPSEEALRAELGRSLPDLPERWRLSHIFLAAGSDAERESARARLNVLRPEIRSLDDFQSLAKEISQSESARRNGRLGVVKPGFLRPEAETAIRALAVGRVSQPVVTGPGVHLFWVEEHVPAGPWLTDDRVSRELARRRAEAVEANRRRLLARAPAAELGPVEADGLPGSLTIGSWTMPGELLRAVVERTDRLTAWVDRERLWRVALAEARVGDEERRRGDDLAADLRLRSRLEDEIAPRIAEPNNEGIAAHFAAHRERFMRPERLAVRYLRVALRRDRDPFEQERALAAEIATVRASAAGLQAIAKARNLPLLSIDLRPLIEVAGELGPLVFEKVQTLAASEIGGPIHDAEVWVVVEIVAKEAARPLEPMEAMPEVRAAIRAERRRAALAARTSELLAGLELTEAGRQWVSEGVQ